MCISSRFQWPSPTNLNQDMASYCYMIVDEIIPPFLVKSLCLSLGEIHHLIGGEKLQHFGWLNHVKSSCCCFDHPVFFSFESSHHTPLIHHAAPQGCASACQQISRFSTHDLPGPVGPVGKLLRLKYDLVIWGSYYQVVWKTTIPSTHQR